MVIISVQYLIDDPAVEMLYGVPVIPDDPGRVDKAIYNTFGLPL